MEKEFIPYEQALALKELGFDELVLGKYQKLSEAANYQLQLLGKERNCNRLDTAISAPIFSQAFRWFREKKSLCSWVYQSNSGLYHYSILKDDRYLSSSYNNETTYKEAELACLKKLIEIVKNK